MLLGKTLGPIAIADGVEMTLKSAVAPKPITKTLTLRGRFHMRCAARCSARDNNRWFLLVLARTRWNASRLAETRRNSFV